MIKQVLQQVSISHYVLILISAIAFFTFISCSDELVLESPDEIMVSHPKELFNGSISGVIMNDRMESLPGVNITVRGEETMSDKNGFFVFHDIELDAYGTIVNAELDSYWSVAKVIAPSKEQQSHIRIILKPKDEFSIIDASTGGVAGFNEELKIEFSENSFVTMTGDTYNGDVTVAANYLNPNDENFQLMSPGDFRAFNNESELQTLQSLGMAGIELRGENDETLELKPEMNARISMKVPEGTNVEEVPLWYFDEKSGYWLEESVAYREGDFYVGDVSHFSWWNCDVQFDAIKLTGSVVDINDNGIGGLPVSIYLENGRWDMGVEFTGDEGIFSRWVPAGASLGIQIKNNCGEIFYEESIGPFNVDTEIPAISPGSQNQIELCGTLKNCDSVSVSDGYLVVNFDGNRTLVPMDENGNFCSSVNICQSTNFEVFGINRNTGLSGSSATYGLADSPLDDLVIFTCEEIPESFIFQINDEPEVVINDFDLSIDGREIYIYTNSKNRVTLSGNNLGSNDYTLGYFVVFLDSPESLIECEVYWCTKPQLDFIEFGGIGETMILKITGTSEHGDDYNIYVKGTLDEY